MTIKTLKTIACAMTLLSSVHVTPAEARAIAKEAYIYGFPMVDSYRIQYGYFVDRQNSEFKTHWNQIRNIPRVYTRRMAKRSTPASTTTRSRSPRTTSHRSMHSGR